MSGFCMFSMRAPERAVAKPNSPNTINKIKLAFLETKNTTIASSKSRNTIDHRSKYHVVLPVCGLGVCMSMVGSGLVVSG